MITHIAYDFGVIDFLGKPSTKKTLCETRVPMSHIDNENPTCEKCKQAKAELDELAKVLGVKITKVTS